VPAAKNLKNDPLNNKLMPSPFLRDQNRGAPIIVFFVPNIVKALLKIFGFLKEYSDLFHGSAAGDRLYRRTASIAQHSIFKITTLQVRNVHSLALVHVQRIVHSLSMSFVNACASRAATSILARPGRRSILSLSPAVTPTITPRLTLSIVHSARLKRLHRQV
jgi:hypothetical protein